jgi:hypothetical protein
LAQPQSPIRKVWGFFTLMAESDPSLTQKQPGMNLVHSNASSFEKAIHLSAVELNA